MHHAAAPPAWVMLAYLVAGVCFILALRGLSSPASSRRGNRLGIAGMTLAVVTTLIHYAPRAGQHDATGFGAAGNFDFTTMAQIAGAIVLGAVIGLATARRIAMTAMPQLVAPFHSLVGLAGVLVAAAAFLNPEAFGIAAGGIITPVSRSRWALARPSGRSPSQAA